MTQLPPPAPNFGQQRWQLAIALVLAFAAAMLAAGLANRHAIEQDWTAANRNTLSASSLEILGQLDQPLVITAFTRDPQLAKAMAQRVALYQRQNRLISFESVNPDHHPDRAAAADITADGVLHLLLGERQETLHQISETSITSAILRLTRGIGVKLLVLTGHGERAVNGDANRDFSNFFATLRQRGYPVDSYQINTAGAIPTDDTLLVISTPTTGLSGGEVARLLAFIAEGGRLLWLGDPGELHGLKPLAIQLGVRFLPGTLVDPAGMAAAGSGAFALATSSAYRNHPITREFELSTVFPLATGVSQNSQKWQAAPLVIVGADGWLEQGDLTNAVDFDPQQDLQGPITLALALELAIELAPERQPAITDNDTPNTALSQRAVIVGDGDFLANAYLGNGGNRQLGLNIISWLTGDEPLLNITPITTTDNHLELSTTHGLLIGLGFLLVLPLLLAITGAVIWWRRR